MAGTERVSRSGDVPRDGDLVAAEAASAPARELLDGVEDLLDEIDEVLEDNAEEFVRGYVQKGGQ